MYGDTDRGGASTALRFVTCDLSSLTDCVCLTSVESVQSGSSAHKRKNRTKPSPHIDPDCLTPSTAKRIYLERPSLVDKLISQSRSVIDEMEGKKRGPKSQMTQMKSKADMKEAVKRKRIGSLDGSSPAVKRLRSSKVGSDSDSERIVRKRGRPPRKLFIDAKSVPAPSVATKKLKEKSRFSKRICFSTASLRSGKKRSNELLKRKRIVKGLGKDSKEKKKWVNNDKTDSNSNVFTENDDEDAFDGSTDSEVSREAFETPELANKKIDKPKNQEDEIKKKKRRRKRDSMWVKRVKKQVKLKVDLSDTLLPPPLAAEGPLDNANDEDEESDTLEEVSDIPILDKENESSNHEISKEKPLSCLGTDDVAMPTLEKEVELNVPLENSSAEMSDTHEESVETYEELPPEDTVESLQEDIQNDIDLNSCVENHTSDLVEDPQTYLDETKTNLETNNLSVNIDENIIDDQKNVSDEVIGAVQNDVQCSRTTVHNDECTVDINLNSEDPCEQSDIIIQDKVELYASIEVENTFNTIESTTFIPPEIKKEIEEPELNISYPEIMQTDVDEEIESKETDISEHDNNINKSSEHLMTKIENSDIHCETTKVTSESNTDFKDISLLDADSTSDMKPQSLDDSFGDFSLSLPDDLELASSPSDEERDEESYRILPDSTECDQQEDSSIEEVHPIDEVRVPNESIEDVLIAPIETEDKLPQLLSKDDAVTEPEKFQVLDNRLKDEELLKVANDSNILNDTSSKEETETKNEELTFEQRQMKESVLQALGLKSLSTQQQEEKPRKDGYTGTLKAVIKLNRSGDKKKMVYQRSEDAIGELEYRICSEVPATEGVPITHLNDIAGIRKNVSKLHQETDTANGTTTTNGHSEDHETSSHDDSKGLSGGAAKESNLIIPEKSSSFSIHPGRLCSDVCSYCFGKFGCLDTPCHVAQLKPDRQKKILENETHLTGESCLCDACYRYVDRKANCPSKTSGHSSKSRIKPPASSQCCVNHCEQQATHTVKKKWLIKLKKSITNKLDIDIDKHSSFYIPLCTQHHYWVDYFTVCGICRMRLNRNHLYSLGSETDRLNLMLAEDGIPARLSDKPFLCKICRYYSNLRLKYTDPSSIPSSGQIFYRKYRRKLLRALDITVSDSEEEPTIKEEKNKTNSTDTNGNTNGGTSSSSKTDENVVISNLANLLGDQPEQPPRIQVKFGNVNIGRLSNLNIGQQSGRDERLPYSDVGLQANLDFQGPAVPDGSWERCVSTIQFDKRTKKLWQDLQKPYGNQSSFLRHLVMLEKYWRAGYLTLTPGSDERATKYLNGVKNRIKSFEGNSSSEKPIVQPNPSVSSSEQFPLITNTGEIEVTPIMNAQKKVSVPVPIEKKPTHLERAKSLVRMVPPTQRYSPPIQRFPGPMYVSSYGYSLQPRPPPLLKIRNNKPMMPSQYYQAIPQSVTSTSNFKPVLPKLPKTLTVTHVPQCGPTITLNRSGITIEKQSGSQITPSLPIEKPSISVFREPAPGPGPL